MEHDENALQAMNTPIALLPFDSVAGVCDTPGRVDFVD
jgi:hypothetical protein